MVRAHTLAFCCAVTTILHGCGPLHMPMPVRPDADTQQAIDKSWDKAMSPTTLLKHQPLLDVLLVSQAYEVGVDKLAFRSEKKVAAGTVVMEIEYDRLKPDQDRFSVKVCDAAQKVLREETYGRKEIEDAYRDLFVRCEELRTKVRDGHVTPDEVKALERLESRFKAVFELFPKNEPAPQKAKEPAR